MKMRAIGIDLANSVFRLVGMEDAWEGSGQEAVFVFSDDGRYGDDSILPHRYGSVLWQSL
jgi:hypothetical protein